MGILADSLDLVRGLALAPGFTVVELGDQWITEPASDRRLARDFYVNELKCKRYESVDGNGRGTITADLNRPLVPWPGEFDLVTDFGTGEHVFDQRQVFKTIHDLCRVGGHIVFDRPTQGYDLHCYWLATAAVFVDVARENGYEVVSISNRDMPRGKLIRGVFRKMVSTKFIVPQQGRYHKLLRPIMKEK